MKIFLSLAVGIFIGFLASVVYIAKNVERKVESEFMDMARTEMAPALVEHYQKEITESGDLIPMIESMISQLEEKIDILLLPESKRSCALLLSADKQFRLIEQLKDTIQGNEYLKNIKFPNVPMELYQSSFTSEQLSECQIQFAA